MGFAVLPAALEMDILMLVRVTRAPDGEAPPPTLPETAPLGRRVVGLGGAVGRIMVDVDR